MTTANVSPDTQVVLLLCGHFSPKESASPLELREYNRLAEWMRQNDLRLPDLLRADASGAIDWAAVNLDRDRVLGLLERGGALALAVEKWTSAGLWIVSRADHDYPKRLRTCLGRSAPALLFGVGDPAALDRGGLSIVGSRDIDAEGQEYTAAVARQCAREGIQVVSGGARGVDEIALASAFEEGGSALAVLPEGLGKASLAAKYRAGIREERLVLLSPYAPHAGFSVGNAMGRNKLVYAMGDAALVVNAALRSGGTWAGAEEELKRERPRPVFVRIGEARLDGNEALLELGARAFPNSPWADGIRDVISQPADVPAVAMTVADAPGTVHEASLELAVSAAMSTTASVYHAVLPVILAALDAPRTQPELAAQLDVQSGQLKLWLDRAIAEGQVVKGGRPAKFSRAGSGAKQVSLFGN